MFKFTLFSFFSAHLNDHTVLNVALAKVPFLIKEHRLGLKWIVKELRDKLLCNFGVFFNFVE